MQRFQIFVCFKAVVGIDFISARFKYLCDLECIVARIAINSCREEVVVQYKRVISFTTIDSKRPFDTVVVVYAFNLGIVYRCQAFIDLVAQDHSIGESRCCIPISSEKIEVFSIGSVNC